MKSLDDVTAGMASNIDTYAHVTRDGRFSAKTRIADCGSTDPALLS